MGAESPFGAGEVLGAGALRAQRTGRCFPATLERKRTLSSGSLRCAGYARRDKRIVFCEGFRVRDNPWFSTLPFAPVRGEILELADDRTEFLNGGTWFLPQGSGQGVGRLDLRLGRLGERADRCGNNKDFGRTILPE